MTEKVILPREVAKTLDKLKQTRDFPIRALVDIFNGMIVTDIQVDTLYSYFESDRSRRIELIIKALVNGWEVEETPEDKVKALWKHADLEHRRIGTDVRQYWNGYLEGMSEALNTFNIKIDGVNS